MNGISTKLIGYMDGSRKRFVIPVYQRNYDWKTENCKQLYDDLVKVIRNNRRSHFFGSIVSVHDGFGEEYLIIDGQQRLTTISLLLLAMHNLLLSEDVTSNDAKMSERLLNEYLVDKYEHSETRIKLKPVKNDKRAFNKLFDDIKDYINESNLTINYNYFYERIKKKEVSIDELFESICKLEIIDISLNHDDNPQLIFESLNSTGLALSEGDKIRNLILMGLPAKMQNEYYEKYWNKIEEFTDYNVSLFVRDYLSIKQQTTPAMSRIYITFKNYVEENELDIEDLLKDLLAYARLYQMLLIGNNVLDKRLGDCIYRLNRLETTVTRLFLLEVLMLNDNGKLETNNLTEVFLTIENYLFRRTICEIPTNMLNKIFLLLHKEIVRYDGTADDYVNKLKFALLSKREKARFPDDEEFSTAFILKQIYMMQPKNKIYLFERLENFGTQEDKTVWNHFDHGEYSIEHIMPQRLTASWINSLGIDYEMIHDTWLHRIANLTITAYNSKYSNNTFEEKKSMKNGFLDSGIRMNQRIAQKDKWGLTELEERSDLMKQRVLEIWLFPETTFKPKEKQLDIYTLDDDIDLTGRTISRISFKNIEQPVKSWIDMYEIVLRTLHSEDKSVLTHLAYTKYETVELSQHVSNNATDFTNWSEIDDDIYVWAKTSTQYKISLLRRFFKLYNVESSTLIFYLKEDDSDDEVVGTINALRKRYWSFALDKLHSVHGEGCFSGVHATTGSWISGFIGINGVNITCTLNNCSTRVELRMENLDKEINKERFDILLKYKEEIESKLGINLIWERGNDIKLSKISIALNEFSISNDSDWEQMADFQAEWSKKFYDVLVYYLKGEG